MRPPTLRSAPTKAEPVQVRIRAARVGVPYAIAVSVFGGATKYVARWFMTLCHDSGFSRDATAAIACSLWVTWLMRGTCKHPVIDRAAARQGEGARERLRPRMPTIARRVRTARE